MLCLARRVSESLQIGETITVTVLGVDGQQVRLGIEAPKALTILREELFERIAKREEERREHAMESARDTGALAADAATAPEKPKPRIAYKRRPIPRRSSAA